MHKLTGITVSRHILDSQHLHPRATGELSSLLIELIVAAKTISAEVNKAGLAGILGQAGVTNIQGEDVQKLDEFANTSIKRRMSRCGHLCVMASEEEADIIPVAEGCEGKYTLAFDPLDGSSNIDVNVSIGTIFSIHQRTTAGGQGSEADLLQAGSRQVAAGYIIYGSSTMLVFSTGDGVHGFTLDPTVGEFYLSHPDIRTPERCRYFSINEGNSRYWDHRVARFVEWMKDEDRSSHRPYSGRYIGSLVADFHRNLISGGIFLYPSDTRNPAKPQGKLRLLYEAAPLAFIAEQAGGRAITDDGRRILDIEADSLHQRVPLIIGGRSAVDMAESFLCGNAGDTIA
ncbi:MAG: class 1 fructose-bisphosphatase [Thermodesulfobacteriota bacterium]